MSVTARCICFVTGCEPLLSLLYPRRDRALSSMSAWTNFVQTFERSMSNARLSVRDLLRAEAVPAKDGGTVLRVGSLEARRAMPEQTAGMGRPHPYQSVTFGRPSSTSAAPQESPAPPSATIGDSGSTFDDIVDCLVGAPVGASRRRAELTAEAARNAQANERPAAGAPKVTLRPLKVLDTPT
jgi:hypothetical protein